MDRVRGLGEDEHVRAHGFQQVEMRAQRLHLRIGVALQELCGIPAGHTGHAEGRQRRLQGLRLARKLVAELHAFETGFLGLGEAHFERGLAAQFRHVVVGPADGIGPDADRHGFSFSRFMSLFLGAWCHPLSSS
jgi:hypothetical protein